MGVGSAIVPLVIVIAGVRGALFITGAIVPAIVLLRLRPLRMVDAAAVVSVVTIALLRSSRSSARSRFRRSKALRRGHTTSLFPPALRFPPR